MEPGRFDIGTGVSWWLPTEPTDRFYRSAFDPRAAVEIVDAVVTLAGTEWCRPPDRS